MQQIDSSQRPWQREGQGADVPAHAAQLTTEIPSAPRRPRWLEKITGGGLSLGFGRGLSAGMNGRPINSARPPVSSLTETNPAVASSIKTSSTVLAGPAAQARPRMQPPIVDGQSAASAASAQSLAGLIHDARNMVAAMDL